MKAAALLSKTWRLARPGKPPATDAAAQTLRPQSTLLLTVFLLTSVEFLQAGMIAFAAVPIMGHISASPEEYSLAAASYAGVAVVTIAKQRWLVERLGWRLYVQLSLAIFVLGCALCGYSHDFPSFLLGRCIMALGGASFMTAGRTVIHHLPKPSRFRGIRYFATGLTTGIAAAPALAVYAVDDGSWTAIFGVLACVAAVTGIVASMALPNLRVPAAERSHSHIAPLVGLAAGSFLLLYSLQRSQYDYFSNASVLLVAVIAGAMAVSYFIFTVARHERPLINLRGLRAPRYLAGVSLFTLCYVLLGANNYMIPVFMQRGQGFGWQSVGQIQTAGLSSGVIAWLVMSYVLPRWPSPKKFFVVGFLALACFGWQLSRLPAGVDPWTDILPALAANGVFVILVLATTATQTFGDVQHNEHILAHAQQLKNILGQIGMAGGIAVATIALQSRTAVHHNALTERLTLGDPAYLEATRRLTEALAPYESSQRASLIALAELARLIDQQAVLLACDDYFLAVAAVGVVGAVVMCAQRLMR